MEHDENAIAPRPPRPRQEPLRRVFHGRELVDEYAWMRAPNWQAALDDPSLLPRAILDHLQAENAYTEWHLAPGRELRERLVSEMRAYMDPRALKPPHPHGPWLYETRYGDGEHPVLVRRLRAGGAETVLLDCNALARSHAFFKLGRSVISPDHRLLAYAVDTVGSEAYRISIRELETGRDLPEVLADTSGSMVWSGGGRALTYVRRGPDLRPNRVTHHRLGTSPAEDALLFTEHDPAWSVWLGKTGSQRFGLVTVHNSDEREVHLFDLAAEAPTLRVVEPRRGGLSYEVDDDGKRLVIRTNADRAEDRKLVTAPADTPGAEHWRDLVPHRPGISILSHRCLAGHIVRTERADALVRIVVRAPGGAEHTVSTPDQVYSLRLEPGEDFDTRTIRYTVSTPLRPSETYDYDLTTRAAALVWRHDAPAVLDASAYVVTRLWATAPDGERVPISLAHRRDLPRDGSAPCLLYGYGAYGSSVDPEFVVERLPLLTRGVVYAIAHVRGGAERGQGWYDAGRLERRTNAFTDFLAAAQALIAAGYTRRGRIVAHGRSAGGMLVGAAVNLDPGLFAGVIADVPFVDVLNTMLDTQLPLTPPEWLEWGNPLVDGEVFDRLRSYAPTEQIRPEPYPPILAEAGVSDPRVTYWEPAKWIARLRDRASGGPFLLTTAMTAGHAGNEGRFRRLEERAREIAFALRCLGLDREPDSGRATTERG
jgi:oligopeptidase B